MVKKKSKTKNILEKLIVPHPTDKTEGIVMWISRSGWVYGSYFNNRSKDHPGLHESLLFANNFFRENCGFIPTSTMDSKLLHDEIVNFVDGNDVGQFEIIDQIA